MTTSSEPLELFGADSYLHVRVYSSVSVAHASALKEKYLPGRKDVSGSSSSATLGKRTSSERDGGDSGGGEAPAAAKAAKEEAEGEAA